MRTMHTKTATIPSLSSLRLVATDLDGTLLRSDKSISEYTNTILQRLHSAGVTIVMITARPPRVLRKFAQSTNIGGLAICCNGAIIYDLDQDRVLQQQALPPQQVEHLITRLRSSFTELSFAGENGMEVICEAAFHPFRSIHDTIQPCIVEISEIYRSPQIKVLVRHATLPTSELHERVIALLDGRAYSVTYSSSAYLEISLGGIHKGAALAGLCAQLGIAAHEVVAFGDMPNDLPLLQWAGLGVAVANAHPLVLAAAHHVTLSNEEDGVAHLLEQLLEKV